MGDVVPLFGPRPDTQALKPSSFALPDYHFKVTVKAGSKTHIHEVVSASAFSASIESSKQWGAAYSFGDHSKGVIRDPTLVEELQVTVTKLGPA